MYKQIFAVSRTSVTCWTRSFIAALGLWLTVTVIPALAPAAVWETTAQWDAAAEANYRQWVLNNWNKEYFVQAGPLQGSLMDCADVIYTMRLLYAAQAGLPFVMRDPTARGVRLITNEMTRWDSKPPEERLKGLSDLIHAVSSTASIPADTYPTVISRETLGSGSIILTGPEKHHSWTIQKFSITGIPYLLFGSRPAQVLLFERNEYPSMNFTFPEGILPEFNAGFRNFRQPKDIGKPVADVPGFSLEQYTLLQSGGMKAIQRRMQLATESPQQHVMRIYKNACHGAQERADSVLSAVQKNKSLGATCMTESQYDDYSTPSRDQRLKDSFLELKAAYEEGLRLPGEINEPTKKLMADVISGSSVAGAQCMVNIGGGKKLTLGQAYALSVNDKLSSNPHDSLEIRWGLAPGPSSKAATCPVY